MSNPYEKLKQWNELLKNGTITQEEFDAIKAKLLNKDIPSNKTVEEKPIEPSTPLEPEEIPEILTSSDEPSENEISKGLAETSSSLDEPSKNNVAEELSETSSSSDEPSKNNVSEELSGTSYFSDKSNKNEASEDVSEEKQITEATKEIKTPSKFDKRWLIIPAVLLIIGVGYFAFFHKGSSAIENPETNKENIDDNSYEEDDYSYDSNNDYSGEENDDEDENDAPHEKIHEKYAQAIEAKVYFYSKPNRNSSTEGYFVKGQTAEILDGYGDFVKVRFEFKGNITIGYVLADNVSFTNTKENVIEKKEESVNQKKEKKVAKKQIEQEDEESDEETLERLRNKYNN